MKSKFISKLLIFVLCVSVIFAAFSLVACGNNDDDKEDKFVQVAGSAGLEYEINDDGDAYTCVGIGTCTSVDVVVGNWYEGKPVTAIGEGAFNDEQEGYPVEIKSITVSNGITSIAMRGLQNMHVEKIILGDKVPELGIAAVRKNKNLKTLVVGKGLTTIKKDCFTLLSDNNVKLNIYYKGSEADWKKISIAENNDYLTSADCTMHYNYSGNGSEL